MSKTLLVMCPTRGRPKIFSRMLESYYATTNIDNTDIIVYTNEDDPCLPEYEKLGSLPLICGKRLYLAPTYNHLFKRYPDYAYYAPINDDHIFITKDWDKKLIEVVETQGKGWGMAAAEDKFTKWNEFQHPSGCVLSGNIPRTLGYFVWPKFQHIGIDCYFMHLLQAVNLLYHVKDVVIEHRHWFSGKALLDANYKWVYSKEQYGYGMDMVEEYLVTKLKEDVDKLKAAINKEVRK